MDHKAELTQIVHHMINGEQDKAAEQLRAVMIAKGLGITSKPVQESTDDEDSVGNHPTEMVHISDIKVGDTVKHDGKIVTVGQSDLKDGENGLTLFGDLYRLGNKKVERVITR